MSGFTYLHMLEGRIRVKFPLLKGSPEKAGQLEKTLLTQKGVNEVKANHRTGSLLIYYDANLISQQRVLETVQKVTRVEEQGAGAVRRYSSTRKNSYSDFILQKAAEFALERLIVALI